MIMPMRYGGDAKISRLSRPLGVLSKHRRRSELAAKWWLASLAGRKETRASEFEFPKGGGVSGLLKACLGEDADPNPTGGEKRREGMAAAARLS